MWQQRNQSWKIWPQRLGQDIRGRGWRVFGHSIFHPLRSGVRCFHSGSGDLCAGLRAFRQLFVRAAWLSWQSGLQGIWDTRFGTRRRASSHRKTTIAILLFPGRVNWQGWGQSKVLSFSISQSKRNTIPFVTGTLPIASKRGKM